MRIVRGFFGKLFLSSLVLSFTLFGVLLVYSVTGVRAALEAQKAEDTQQIVGRTDQYLDLYFQSIQGILVQLSDAYESAPLAIHDSLRTAVQANSGVIGGAYVVSAADATLAGDQLLYDIVGHPRLADLRELAASRPFEAQWAGPYYSPLLTAQTVAFARGAGSPDLGHAAVIILEVDLDRLKTTLSNFLARPGQAYLLLNAVGDVVAFDPSNGVLPVDRAQVPAVADAEFVNSLAGLPAGISRETTDGGGVTVIRSNRSRLGWSLFVLIEDEVYLRRINDLYQDFLAIGGAFLVVLVIGTLVFSRHFSLPVHRLAVAMDSAQDPGSAVIPRTKRRDEIATLYSSFERMIERMRQLRDAEHAAVVRRKDLELRLLHSQVRPHFVGNTLACIASLAKQGRTDEVVQTLRSLILLLTTTADQIEQLTTLRQELECLDAYVRLQKMRRGDVLQYERSVDEICLENQVPKLLLEPLVENAILHGFADQVQTGMIVVKGSCDEGTMTIEVSDNGIGIGAQSLARIRAALDRDEPFVDYPLSEESTSVGLKNTHERLRAAFGTDAGLLVRSAPGEGTTVVLRLPIRRGSLSNEDDSRPPNSRV